VNAEKEQSDSDILAVDPQLAKLKATWSVYSHGDLKQRCKEIGSDKQLIEGLLPDRSITLLVGDSGLGKSALVYQMGLCIAAGVPFLGRTVKQGRVLCLDFENGLGQVDEIITGLCTHLGLSKAPESIQFWNINDATSKYGQQGHTEFDIIRNVKPDLVIIDSLTGLFPDIEERNSFALKALQKLRELIREYGTSSYGGPQNQDRFSATFKVDFAPFI
jgi:RecA-family ATPase